MREEHRCDAMRKSNTGRRRGNGVYEYGVVTMAAVVILHLCLDITLAAPAAYDSSLPQSGEIAEYFSNNEYISGCYYNFQRYEEGDRIVTNEPCLNCTCHNRMLMCYLRVCPFTKAIGQDCTIEKKPDQCCPIITCPEVPVKLLTSSTTSSPTPTTQTTEVGFHDNYGCSIDDSFYPDGAQVPSDPRKPCELCYCIRNRTACVMQECTLHVEGCKPVYQDGICCPVRYDCDYEKEMMSTSRPQTSGGFIKSTTFASVIDCQYGNQSYSDGESIETERPCEHCYCMRGDIVCAVQDCGEPLRGKDCVPKMPPPEKCCPSSYDCTNDTSSTTESITKEPFNTEAPTTFGKSTPYAIHTSSVLTPEEIYTKLGENKSPGSTNSSKPATSDAHPSEGIQMDSNSVDAGEHFPTTTLPNRPAILSSHQPSSTSHPETPAEGLTTAAEIPSTSFQQHPSYSEPQTTVISGDEPTTSGPDFSSVETETTKATTTSRKPIELYSPASTSIDDASITTQGYTKLSETTKYDSNEIPERETERVTSATDRPTASYPSGNEIADNGQLPSKPNEAEQKLPQDTITKVPSDSSPGVTTEANEYSTNAIHKIDSTTPESAVTETKNTIADKNTQPIGNTGAEQPTQNTIQGSSDAADENSVSQTEKINPGLDSSPTEEPAQTTHYPDFSSIGTKEPAPTTSSHPPTSVDYHTESPSGFSSHSPIHNGVSEEDGSSHLADGETTVSSENTVDQSHETTINNLISDSTYSPTTSSSGSSEADHVSYTQPPQTTLHLSSADRVDIPESQTNVNPPASDGADASASLETTTGQSAAATPDLPASSQTKEPIQEVAEGADNTVPYTKQPALENTHQAASSVYETTVTYPSPANSISTELGEGSTLAPTLSTPDGSAVIPGEGSCLVDGITYPNASVIESSNPCHSKCVCLSSIPTCTLISCNPPPTDPKCMPVQIKPESCCPLYVCDGADNPAAVPAIASDNHIAQNDIGTAPTTKQPDLTTPSEEVPTQPQSAENVIDNREKPTSISPSTDSSEAPSTSSSTHLPEPIVSDEVHETSAPISHDSSHEGSHDGSHEGSHDENEISNDVSSGTDAPVIPSANDSQLKNTSHPTPLSNDVATNIPPVYSTSDKVSSLDESTSVSTDGVIDNNAFTTTENATSSSQQEYTSVSQSQPSTEYPSDTTPSKETSESNEIAVSPELEKDSVTTPEPFPKASEEPTTPPPEDYTTTELNPIPDESSTASPSSSSEYTEIKTTTSEPNQNVQNEITHSSAEPSHDLYSTSSESTTIIDDSNNIITAPPEQPVPSSSEKATESSSAVYETSTGAESENLPAETTTSSSLDHSEDAGQPTTIGNEVYSTEIPLEEISSPVVPSSENKFQEKLSTPAPSSETEAYQSVATGSATSAPASSELPSESPTGGYETTVFTEEEVATTKPPSGDYSSYSTPASQSEIGSSTPAYYSTTSPPMQAVTDHEVTEINTQSASSVTSSAKITQAPEYETTKITLAPEQNISEGSADSITTTVAPASDASSVQSSQPSSPSPEVTTTAGEEAPTTISASQSSFWSSIPEKVASLLNQTTSSAPPTSSTSVTYPPIQHSTWTRKPIDEESTSEPNYNYPHPPMYPPGIEVSGVDGPPVEEYDEENGAFGPGTCRYAGKVYVSAQQIPRDDPCDFCFCFRSDIICLQQSCPPPIHGCRQEPIEGFCCPRYECPVSTYGSHNTSTTTTTTTTTTTAAPSRPPRFPYSPYRNAARRTGCLIHGKFYDVGHEIPIASGPCLECLCGSDGSMKCDPKLCSPEPYARQLAAAESK